MDAPVTQVAIRWITRGRLFATANMARRTDEIFTKSEIQRQIIEPSGLELVQPIDFELSSETFDNLIHWRRGGTLEPRTGAGLPAYRAEGARRTLDLDRPAVEQAGLTPLRIGLDAVFLQPRMGGLETLVRRLVPALVDLRPDIELIVFANEGGAHSLRREPMVAKPGDAIVQDPNNAKDTYRIAAGAFACTYEVVKPAATAG